MNRRNALKATIGFLAGLVGVTRRSKKGRISWATATSEGVRRSAHTLWYKWKVRYYDKHDNLVDTYFFQIKWPGPSASQYSQLSYIILRVREEMSREGYRRISEVV